MKDVNEVMREMEEITAQLAATLNEEMAANPVEKESISKGEIIFEYNADPSAEVKGCGCPPAAPEQTPEDIILQQAQACSRFIPFCCLTPVPDWLTPIASTATPTDFRIAYDPRELRCFVDEVTAPVALPPGCPPITFPVYAVRVAGCLPFAASIVAYLGRCGFNVLNPASPTDRVGLCCNDTICVNNVLCYRSTRAAAEQVCAAFRAALAANPCAAVTLQNVTATNLPVFFPGTACNGRRVLAFTGRFVLPNICS